MQQGRTVEFLDLHLEEKIEDLFRDSEFVNLLKKGKEQVKRAPSRSSIRDIFHGLDNKNFIHPRVFFHNCTIFRLQLTLMELTNIHLLGLVICGRFIS